MKKIILLFVFIGGPTAVTLAQSVGIGTLTPHPSAKLEIAATDKGLLVPRLTTAQRTAIAAPATGLLVFDTDTNSFWFYVGGVWQNISSLTTAWALGGNAGTNPLSNFVGTTDKQSLLFRMNNQSVGFWIRLGMYFGDREQEYYT